MITVSVLNVQFKLMHFNEVHYLESMVKYKISINLIDVYEIT